MHAVISKYPIFKIISNLEKSLKLRQLSDRKYMTDTKPAIDRLTIDGDLFKVLVNEDGQYSIWPTQKSIPSGWLDKGFEGGKTDCSDFIDQQWTDMRPRSLRESSHKE